MEYNKILIRFAELSLKKNNKFFFINQLVSNIKKFIKINIEKSNDRLFIPYKKEYLDILKTLVVFILFRQL